jgi:predicted GNAT family acetyltransferase
MVNEQGIEVVAPTGEPERDAPLLDAVRAFLAQEEAINSIQLSGLHSQPGFLDGVSCLIARRDGEVRAVTSHYPGFNTLVSHSDDPDAVRALAAAAVARNWPITGVMARSDVSRAFSDAWSDATGDRIVPGMSQRMLATSVVTPPEDVPGRWRHATPADKPFLREWIIAFAIEADHQSPERAAEAAESMVERSPDGLIWLDAGDVPVSIACYKARTPRGMRIGPVYTPPGQRRRGYAAAVTAATSQYVLEHGCEFVCLYTVASNATANHVYESIGYEWVADSMIYRFVGDEDDDS